MKKIQILLLLLLFMSSNAMAQLSIMADNLGLIIGGQDISKFSVLDSSNLNITYVFRFKSSEVDDTLGFSDEHLLMIGNRYTKYYSQELHDMDVLNYKIYQQLGENGAKASDGTQQGYEIINEIKSKELLITQRPPFANNVYRYNEKKPNLKWQITDDTCCVLGYVCNKATTSFAGRDYIAWFSPDIPIPYGPYKFGGLPGLILKIEDTKNNFRFISIGVDQKHEAIKLYKWSYQETTREKWRKFEKEIHEHSGKYMKTTGSRLCLVDPNSADGEREITNDWSTYYNPIEKE